MPRIIALLPLMECFTGDAEMAAGPGNVLRPMMVVHPGKAHARLTGQNRSRLYRQAPRKDVGGIHIPPIVLLQSTPAHR